MKLAFYDTHSFEREAFEKENVNFDHEIRYFEPRLTEETTSLAQGFEGVCAFVNDRLNGETLRLLKESGVKLIALRSAGFNHVDREVAKSLGLKVVRVPEYSPYAIAEHVVALIQTLNRKTHKAYNRVREGNFSLNGLVGFDLHEKTVGIIGTGRIGEVLARIMTGFGCRVLLNDMKCREDLAHELHCQYVDVEKIYRESDIISLHIPLTKETRHFIDERAFSLMKNEVMLINTGRGALIDSKALIQALKTGRVGSAGLDVYEEEESVFFQDLSGKILTDDVLARLMTFPNVLITGHQAFLTNEALKNIAETTLRNVSEFEKGEKLTNEVL